MAVALQDAIHQSLRALDGLDDARDLFAELNYRYADSRIPRTGWPDVAQSALVDDPRVIARHGDFRIIYCRQTDDFLRRTTQREVITRLLPTNPYALFLFSDDDASDWHLINVKYDDDTPTRRVFRRFEVGPDERQGNRLRTISEQLTEVALKSHELDELEERPLEIQRRYDEAFDVEAVTRRFYKEYREVFTQVEQGVAGYFADPDQQRIFTQRLFNRLMFLRFIEKKGWLRFPDQRGNDYLTELWRRYTQARTRDDSANFYSDRLKLLFFNALDTPHGTQEQLGYIGELIGEVPYLNGGLFEQDEDDLRSEIQMPDESIDLIINRLFDRFNFTVTESTPLDVEVAVDPEMLGKVFEELVTGRHETGSYYTPKPVVSFMCQEALKGYLETELPNEKPDAINRFVERQEPDKLVDAEAVLDALKRVQSCDPACGSGAYLLGLLHELFELRNSLFRAGKVDAPTAYRRKLDIILRNLYGVDIDPFAVNIARLRLWLSLAVDYEGEKPEPLPNLDYKIEIGDSLLGPGLPPADRVTMRAKAIEDLIGLKKAFMTSHSGQRRHFRDQIEAKKRDISDWTYGGKEPKGFDWASEFAEVFYEDGRRQGFDIMLANPPYVRADAQFRHITEEEKRQAAIQEWKAYRKALSDSKSYSTLFQKWDLYIPFLERGFQLLRSEGTLVYIVSDALNGTKYALKCRHMLVEQSTIRRLDFCSDIDLFDAGINNTIVSVNKNSPPEGHCPERVRRWGDKRDEFITNAENLLTHPQPIFGESLFRLEASLAPEMMIDHVELGKIVYISVGMVVHAHEDKAPRAFSKSDLISTKKDATHPKAFVEGKDISCWVPHKIRYLEYGTERAPRLFRRPTFPEMYEVPEKLIAKRITTATPQVVYDDQALLHNHTALSFVPWESLSGVENDSIRKTSSYAVERGTRDREQRELISWEFEVKYLLAIMNSSFAADWFRHNRRSKSDLYPDDWKTLPIARIPRLEQKGLSNLVDKILVRKQMKQLSSDRGLDEEIQRLESEIDSGVARLYGLLGKQ